MTALHDPEVEAGAIALCWLQRPTSLFPKLSEQTLQHRLDWWHARSERDQELYRYRASVVLEAVDEARMSHAE